MAAAETHASGTRLLALPEVFEADADEAVRADRHGRSLFLGGGADIAVHVDSPLAGTNATPPYAHHPRRSIPECTLEHDAVLRWRARHRNADSSLRSRRRFVLKPHGFRRINPSDPGDRSAAPIARPLPDRALDTQNLRAGYRWLGPRHCCRRPLTVANVRRCHRQRDRSPGVVGQPFPASPTSA